MEFILLAASVPTCWSERVRDTELAWLQDGLGPRTTDALVKRAEYWYSALFVEPGLVETSYRITLPGDEDVAAPCGTCSNVCVFGAGVGKEPFEVTPERASNVATVGGALTLTDGATEGFIRKLLIGWPVSRTCSIGQGCCIPLQGASP